MESSEFWKILEDLERSEGFSSYFRGFLGFGGVVERVGREMCDLVTVGSSDSFSELVEVMVGYEYGDPSAETHVPYHRISVDVDEARVAWGSRKDFGNYFFCVTEAEPTSYVLLDVLEADRVVLSAWADNPQAVQIDALIRRARRLTPVECDRLVAAGAGAAAGAAAWARVAAWDAAWDAARVAAGAAAWFAAGDAARFAARVAAAAAARDAAAAAAAAGAAAGDAARVAAGAAARAAAGDAARVAAGALVVRDLIEEATPWDWAAYDLLTGPWRRVIGPVHPDDEVLR
jgi:hypothetical protein